MIEKLTVGIGWKMNFIVLKETKLGFADTPYLDPKITKIKNYKSSIEFSIPYSS